MQKHLGESIWGYWSRKAWQRDLGWKNKFGNSQDVCGGLNHADK